MSLFIIMKVFEQVSYDSDVDACYIKVSKNKVCDSEMKKSWLIVDKDKDWKIVWIEILNVKNHKGIVEKLVLSEKDIEKCLLF